MSQPLKTAVVAAMLADTELDALLARDPNDEAGEAPAIFNSHKNAAPPVYNCITFREQFDTPDQRFRAGTPGGGRSPIANAVYEFEAWTDQPDSAPVDAMLDRLVALFDNQALALEDGRAFNAEVTMRQADLYDKDANVFFGLMRIRFRTRRT